MCTASYTLYIYIYIYITYKLDIIILQPGIFILKLKKDKSVLTNVDRAHNFHLFKEVITDLLW